MNRFGIVTTITCAIACTLTLTACNQSNSASNTGRVAILDIQRVAKESGYARQINRQLGELRNHLQTQLTGVQTQLNSKLNDKQIEFGKKPNKEQVKELNQLFTTAKAQLENAQQKAVSVVKTERSHLSNQLFDIVRPYAKRVANGRGLDIVMLKSDLLVFDHNPKTDITDEVIAAVVEAKADVTLQLSKNNDKPDTSSKPIDKTTD